MKAVKRILIAVAIIIVLAAGAFVGLFLSEYLDTKSDDGTTVVVVVPEGAGGGQIADILKENGLIRMKPAFKLRLSQSGNASKLRSGTFELHKGMCIDDIIQALITGGDQRPTVDITIPEGFSIEMIADRLENMGLFTAQEFLDEAENGEFDYDILESIPDDENIKYRLQGFLFPSTYSVYADATPHEVIDMMLSEFVKRYEGIQSYSGLSPFEQVTIASLIERESQRDDERAKIAGVIVNRLTRNMPLQIDAAIIYAVSDGKYDMDRVLYSDLEVESPYNVYKNPGLPVGPICSPGEKSLEAAMNPESHEYLFYHTDETKNDGSHIFTKSYDEHLDTMN